MSQDGNAEMPYRVLGLTHAEQYSEVGDMLPQREAQEWDRLFALSVFDWIRSRGVSIEALNEVFNQMIVNAGSISKEIFFRQLVRIENIDHILGNSLPVDKRWSSENIPPQDVTALGLQKNELGRLIKGLSHELTRRAQNIVGVTTEGLQVALKDPRAERHIREYGEAFFKIMDELSSYWKEYLNSHEVQKSNHYTLLLLEEARGLKKYFGQENGNTLDVDAKRINIATEDEHNPEEIMYGYGYFNFEGSGDFNQLFEEMRSNGPIVLTIPDDCGATLGSAMAAVFGLKEKGVDIKEVIFVSSVANQLGLEAFIQNMTSIGIKPTVMVGDIVSSVDYHGYLERDGEEIYDVDGNPTGEYFEPGQPAVSDMGNILTRAHDLSLGR